MADETRLRMMLQDTAQARDDYHRRTVKLANENARLLEDNKKLTEERDMWKAEYDSLEDVIPLLKEAREVLRRWDHPYVAQFDDVNAWIEKFEELFPESK